MESSCSIVEDAAGPKGRGMKPNVQGTGNGRAGHSGKGAVPNESFASASSKRKGMVDGQIERRKPAKLLHRNS